jgi:pimeloyl-ACP methyl ester carboxylesterase
VEHHGAAATVGHDVKTRRVVNTQPRNDVRALASLTGAVADRTVIDTTQHLHGAIAARVFRAVPGSAPVRITHDLVSGTVYRAVRVGVRGLSSLGAMTAGIVAGDREVRWLEGAPGRGTAHAIVHGILGDQLTDAHPELDLPVRIRVRDHDVEVTPDALAAAFPGAGRRVAVLLHGLTESDRSWDAPRRQRREPAEVVAHGVEQAVEAASLNPATGATQDTSAAVLPDVLAELGWTPVRLRYGTGRAIGRNGVELDALLEQLVAAWPGGVDELALVGHSMGGLVARSACVVGQDARHAWVERVTHTVSLGTPHLGSWLERVANRGTVLLRRLPEGEVIARVIDSRARGIKDLRFGSLDDAAWGAGVLGPDGHGDLDVSIPAPGAEVDPPLLEGATHHLVAGRLTRSPRHPVTRLFGDLLVTPPSALGRGRTRRLTGGRIETLQVPAGHFRLLRDPAVADHLRRWLA